MKSGNVNNTGIKMTNNNNPDDNYKPKMFKFRSSAMSDKSKPQNNSVESNSNSTGVMASWLKRPDSMQKSTNVYNSCSNNDYEHENKVESSKYESASSQEKYSTASSNVNLLLRKREATLTRENIQNADIHDSRSFGIVRNHSSHLNNQEECVSQSESIGFDATSQSHSYSVDDDPVLRKREALINMNSRHRNDQYEHEVYGVRQRGKFSSYDEPEREVGDSNQYEQNSPYDKATYAYKRDMMINENTKISGHHESHAKHQLNNYSSDYDGFASRQAPQNYTNLRTKLNSIPKATILEYQPKSCKRKKETRNYDGYDEYNPPPKRDDLDNTEYPSSNESNGFVSDFKTAKEKLVIDMHKKQQEFANNNKSGPMSTNNDIYGKRAMCAGGTGGSELLRNNGNQKRAGIHGKFSLPVPRANNESNSKNTGATAGNLILDSETSELAASMKNIEPKLIEIITSEVMDKTPPITWSDIAGLDFVKKTIKEIVVWPMLRPDIFFGLRSPPKGLLLFGPPGTGKTLIAKCIANESKSKFFNISSSTLTSKWQGESEKLVKVLFEVARHVQPSVIFIDEIDSLLAQRSDDDRESSRRLKTEFFIQMDGAKTETEDRILIIGATNRPQELDEAARRRFVKKLYIPLPEIGGRRQIIENLMRKQSFGISAEEVEEIARLTRGYSGADMTNLCREAALGPIRSLDTSSIVTIDADQIREINFNDFVDAMSQVKATVSDSDLDAYFKWNNSFGSVPLSKNNSNSN